jgi:hypothetical protein
VSLAGGSIGSIAPVQEPSQPVAFASEKLQCRLGRHMPLRYRAKAKAPASRAHKRRDVCMVVNRSPMPSLSSAPFNLLTHYSTTYARAKDALDG